MVDRCIPIARPLNDRWTQCALPTAAHRCIPFAGPLNDQWKQCASPPQLIIVSQSQGLSMITGSVRPPTTIDRCIPLARPPNDEWTQYAPPLRSIVTLRSPGPSVISGHGTRSPLRLIEVETRRNGLYGHRENRGPENRGLFLQGVRAWRTLIGQYPENGGFSGRHG